MWAVGGGYGKVQMIARMDNDEGGKREAENTLVPEDELMVRQAQICCLVGQAREETRKGENWADLPGLNEARWGDIYTQWRQY
jgi:hypothetical protein